MATEDIRFWECGCPKPIPCNSNGYIQITLTLPTSIPQVNSFITTNTGATGKFLASDTLGKNFWIEPLTGSWPAPDAVGNLKSGMPEWDVSPGPQFTVITTNFCCDKCIFQYVKRGIIICEGTGAKTDRPNTQYNTAFSQDYYFNSYPNIPDNLNTNNCCHGQFGWFKNGNLSKRRSLGSIFITKNNRGLVLGDISYPRNQRGRWNQSTTNTKLYPIISRGRGNPVCNPNINPATGKCIGYKGSRDGTLRIQKQSGRLFSNTNPNMSKKQLFSYLVKNRKYLNR